VADVILRANGKPAKPMNRCIFHECGKPIPIPAQFCDDGKDSHWRLVPHHLRRAFIDEQAWMRKHKLPADPHYYKLLECCLNRAIQVKAAGDPDFAKRLADFLSAEATRARAQELGLTIAPADHPVTRASPEATKALVDANAKIASGG
jgi:hypothetical protein